MKKILKLVTLKKSITDNLIANINYRKTQFILGNILVIVVIFKLFQNNYNTQLLYTIIYTLGNKILSSEMQMNNQPTNKNL